MFISKTEDGKTHVRETSDSQAAVGGGLWGALLGMLIAGPIGTLVGGARLTQSTLTPAMVERLRNALAPTARQPFA